MHSTRDPGFRSRRLLPALAALLLLGVLWPAQAAAFCGFYVSRAQDQELLNEATTVILMREGTRTVLSMQNDYRGPVEDFALIVPVPVVLAEADVRVLPEEVFARIDRLSAPRLVEYWERDPCERHFTEDGDSPFGDAPSDYRTDESRSTRRRAEPSTVVVEARFAVGEYRVEVLSATESLGLEAWLSAQGYVLPANAAALLEPYVQTGSKFFAAKVDAERVRFDEQGRARLSPLRLHYDSDDFALPIRLGLINAPAEAGPQDLIVHILAPGLRYETSNYDTVPIPTNVEVESATAEHFAPFYAALFDRTLEANPGSVVLEYAWGAKDPYARAAYGLEARSQAPTKCDPCPPGLEGGLELDDLLSLGLAQLPSYAKLREGEAVERSWAQALPRDFVHTRLHARYRPGERVEDLIFHATGAAFGGNDADKQFRRPELTAAFGSRFQARYVIRHRWIGPITCEHPSRGRWDGTPPGAPSFGAPAVHSALELPFVERDAALESYVSAAELAAIDEHLGLGALPKLKVDASRYAPPEVQRAQAGARCSVVDADPNGDAAALAALGLFALIGLRRRSRRAAAAAAASALALPLLASGCAGDPSPSARAPERAEAPKTLETPPCDRYVELARADGLDPAEARRDCDARLERAKAPLSPEGVAALEWCAAHAQRSATLIGCLDATWDTDTDTDTIVAAAVSPPAPPFPSSTSPAYGEAPPEPPPAPPEPITDAQRIERAMQLYAQADAHFRNQEWEDAMALYDAAYREVPDRHALALNVGLTAHNAGRCAQARSYLEHFLAHADPEAFAEDLSLAKILLERPCRSSQQGRAVELYD